MEVDLGAEGQSGGLRALARSRAPVTCRSRTRLEGARASERKAKVFTSNRW